MGSRHLFLSLIVAGSAATGGLVAASTMGKADNTASLDHVQHMHGSQAATPTMSGQDAFGTIQEIVRILEADPTTEWSKVNIDALREHLIDMNEVTLHAAATERALDNGMEISVTGEGRTRDAIKRMIPAHAHELNAIGWQAKTGDLPNGVRLVVTATDPGEVTKLKRSASWASWCRGHIISFTIS